MDPNMLEWALNYAQDWHLHVFPVWWVREDGTCGCGVAGCESVGKHPAPCVGPKGERGHRAATTDPVIIRSWWERWPEANIGLAMAASGLVGIDVDPRNGGDRSIWEWEREHGQLDTLTQFSGGGGRHHIYRAPEDVTSWPKTWLEGVDIKYQGYLVVAPSLHASGGRYRWSEPLQAPRALPLPVQRAILEGKGSGEREDAREGGVGKPVIPTDEWALAHGFPRGQRNDMMLRILRRHAGRHDDFPGLVEFAALVNDASPEPMAELELRRVVKSAWGYHEKRKELPDDDPMIRRGLHPLNDLGNAWRLIDMHGEDFIVSQRGIFDWDGTRYRHQVRGVDGVAHLAHGLMNEILFETVDLGDDPDQRAAVKRWAHRSGEANKITAATRLACQDPRVQVSVSEFDAEPLVINTPTGWVDLATGKLHEHRRAPIHTKITGVGYQPGAVCPEWERFVARSLPDPDDLLYLRCFLGYCLTADTSEKQFTTMWGEGDNGKSIIMDIFTRIMGDYAGAVAKSLVIVGRRDAVSGGAAPSELAKLAGLRFITLSVEPEGRESLNTGFLKSWTGGDVQTAHHKYGHPFDFLPTGKLVYGTNHKPGVRDLGQAFMSRVHLLPFTVSIRPGHPDRIPNKDSFIRYCVDVEGPGILAWAVRGCLEWQVLGKLPVTVDMEAARTEWERDEDVYAQFVDECGVVATDRVETSKGDMLVCFNSWRRSRNEREVNVRVVARELKRLGFRDTRDGWFARVGSPVLRWEAGGV